MEIFDCFNHAKKTSNSYPNPCELFLDAVGLKGKETGEHGVERDPSRPKINRSTVVSRSLYHLTTFEGYGRGVVIFFVVTNTSFHLYPVGHLLAVLFTAEKSLVAS